MGSFIAYACDGLKDFVTEREIVQLIDANQSPVTSITELEASSQKPSSTPIAKTLVEKALSNMTEKRHDNVSIVAVKAKVTIEKRVAERPRWSWNILYIIYSFFQSFICGK